MTQVWMYRDSDTDIHLFNRFEHLEPSVRITYSRCTDVSVVVFDVTSDYIRYKVTGKNAEQQFEEIILFKRLPVWTEPSHL